MPRIRFIDMQCFIILTQNLKIKIICNKLFINLLMQSNIAPNNIFYFKLKNINLKHLFYCSKYFNDTYLCI